MGANGDRRPAAARIEIVSSVASESDAAAIVAGIERFLAETAPASPQPPQRASRWQRAALEEGVSARQIAGRTWGVAGPNPWG